VSTKIIDNFIFPTWKNGLRIDLSKCFSGAIDDEISAIKISQGFGIRAGRERLSEI